MKNLIFVFIAILVSPQLVAQTDPSDNFLNASDYHEIRSGLKNSQLKFERNRKGRVAFVGGSITHMNGWRDSVSAYLISRFPKTDFEFIPAGIGSMGSTPAAFRLERDVLSHGKIDLLFEEAAVNDASNGRTAIEQLRGMEGIVRHLRHQSPSSDIVMMHFVDPDKMKTYREGKTPEVIKNHERVAAHYNIPTVNLAKEVTDRIDHGEFNWKDDFKNLHPSPFGQGIYARSIIEFLEDAFKEPIKESNHIIPHKLPNKLDPFCYDDGHLADVSLAKFQKGWYIDPMWNPRDGTGTRENYVDVPMLVNEGIGSLLKFRFKGKAIGIAVAAGKDAGMITYRIDRGEWRTLNLYTQWSKHLHIPWYYTLAGELTDKNHQLEIKVNDEKDGMSTGRACRIRYFYINK